MLSTESHRDKASPRALVSWVSFLKKKNKTKNPIQQKLYLLRLLSSFSVQRVPLAIPFWILEKLLDFITFSLAILFYIIAKLGF